MTSFDFVRPAAPGVWQSFIWPMLWQSTALITLLLTIDLVFRRRLRPAIRYVLWLVVLLKLLLPPSLALPTSVAWWVRPAGEPPARHYQAVVTLKDGPLGEPDPSPVPVAAAPAALSRWTASALMLTGWAVVSLGLVTWMVFRWWRFTVRVSAACPGSPALQALLEGAQARADSRTGRGRLVPAYGGFHRLVRGRDVPAGVRRPVDLRLTDAAVSPAVYGLFRPVILLPRDLAEHLSAAQLQAVLMHEVMHLRRKDIWVNCLQALLQAVYWWHPLLWLANARIRRLREEAVDDAVVLAMRDEADQYAPALLEVAKLALSRPAVSLGVVGILESKTALRQRIERLAELRAPRKAWGAIPSGACFAAFAALALPMGQAPAPGQTETAPQQIFIAAAEPRSDALADAGQADSPTNVIHRPGRQAVLQKLNTIHFDRISFDCLPLSEVVHQLTDLSKQHDPEGRGLNFSVRQNVREAPGPTIDPATGLPVASSDPQALGQNPGEAAICIRSALHDLSLTDLLDAIVAVADRPLRYSIEDDGVVFGPRDGTGPLYSRVIKLDPTSFRERVAEAVGADPKQLRAPMEFYAALLRFLQPLGVDMKPPKTVFFNDREGTLVTRATLAELDKIERGVAALSAPMSPKRVTDGTPNMVVSIDPGGDLRLGPGGEAVTLDQLQGELVAAAANTPHLSLTIHADKAAPFGRIVRVMDAAKKAGVRVAMQAQPTTEPDTLLNSFLKQKKIVEQKLIAAQKTLGEKNPELRTLQNQINDLNGKIEARLKSVSAGTEAQILLKTKFVEVDQDAAAALWTAFLAFDMAPGDPNRILNPAQAQDVLKTLKSSPGAAILAESSVTTLSGRQAQVQVQQTQTIVTDIDPSALTPPGVPKTGGVPYVSTNLPLGPSIDLLPKLAEDHQHIELTAIANLTEFVGYDKPTNSTPVYVGGERKSAPQPLPRFKHHRMESNAVLLDGQTMMLGGAVDRNGQPAEKPHGQKQVLVFVTVKLLDSTGNERK